MSDNLKVASFNVSLLEDLKAGKNCAREAATAIEQLEAELASQQAAFSEEIKKLREFALEIEALLTPSDRVSIDGNERLGHILASIKDAIHKQQAAREAEIEKLPEQAQFWQGKHMEVSMELSAANAACTRKDEALKLADELLRDLPSIGGLGVLEKTSGALSASQQQVSEWERKQLEPLRAQVAMLQKFVVHTPECKYGYSDNCTCGLNDAMLNTQATAEQFIAECEQRGAVKALEDAANRYDASARIYGKLGYDVAGYDVAGGLRTMAAELRATSKKAG